MKKLILILGGARSGKSSFGLKLAKSIKKKKLFIATCIPEDEEMKKRVRLHRRKRPSSWRTIEERKELLPVLKKETRTDIVIIIDCLTLFISTLLMERMKENTIKNKVERIVKVIKQGKATVIIISNEVGSGLIPDNRLGRDFRDITGLCNQIVGATAEEVYFMVSGIPIQIKEGKDNSFFGGIPSKGLPRPRISGSVWQGRRVGEPPDRRV